MCVCVYSDFDETMLTLNAPYTYLPPIGSQTYGPPLDPLAYIWGIVVLEINESTTIKDATCLLEFSHKDVVKEMETNHYKDICI